MCHLLASVQELLMSDADHNTVYSEECTLHCNVFTLHCTVNSSVHCTVTYSLFKVECKGQSGSLLSSEGLIRVCDHSTGVQC